MLSAHRIYIKLYSPPSLRSIVRSIAQCPARRGSIVRSTAQCPARRVAQENALHVPCDHTARSIAQCPVLHCIANIVQRSVLAAVSPSQVKPSAAASGGTAQRSTEHCQCSNDTKRFRRCARWRFTAPSASLRLQPTLRAALNSARHCTAPPPSIAQRPALHCTEHSEPRQGRSQHANEASCAKGVSCVFFVRLAPMKIVLRTPELAPCAKN